MRVDILSPRCPDQVFFVGVGCVPPSCYVQIIVCRENLSLAPRLHRVHWHRSQMKPDNVSLCLPAFVQKIDRSSPSTLIGTDGTDSSFNNDRSGSKNTEIVSEHIGYDDLYADVCHISIKLPNSAGGSLPHAAAGSVSERRPAYRDIDSLSVGSISSPPRTAGTLPPMTPGGSPRSPVMSVSKMLPEKKEATKEQIQAYVLKLHHASSPQTSNASILEVQHISHIYPCIWY
jgi:hypothetical protein